MAMCGTSGKNTWRERLRLRGRQARGCGNEPAAAEVNVLAREWSSTVGS
jgi:hypothetical protein